MVARATLIEGIGDDLMGLLVGICVTFVILVYIYRYAVISILVYKLYYGCDQLHWPFNSLISPPPLKIKMCNLH